MDAKALREITSELRLLYVEDDTALRNETAKLFTHLFQNIDTAENGQEALDKLENSSFDLIVTDINMPVMNGVTLCKEIRKILPTQAIVITSAHDDAEYLLELINIGIDKFIVKPLDMQKFLGTLGSACTLVHNAKLITKYKKDIEASNLLLSKNNDELQNVIKILDNKILQLNNNQDSQTNFQTEISYNSNSEVNKVLVEGSTDLYTYESYLSASDLSQLKKLENDIDSITTLFNLQHSINEQSVLHLYKILKGYEGILHHYPLFSNLSQSIQELSITVEAQPKAFIHSCNEICILLESFIYVLKKWRSALFIEGVTNPNLYDQSMINDISTIIIILQGSDSPHEDDSEFF